MPKARSGFTLMKHKDFESAPVEVPTKSFENHWQEKGWEEVSDEEAEQLDAEALELENTPLSEMTKAQLEKVASSRGIDTSEHKSKGELLAALQS